MSALSTSSRLRALLAEEGGPLADALTSAKTTVPAPFASLVTCGPRTRTAPEEYALLVESIFEGYLVHYGRGRLVAGDDADMRLLAGDFLYALGLSRLARLGDLEAVGELGDLIGLCARAHALPNDGAEGPWRLTGALWGLCTLAVAFGSSQEHADAKQAAREHGFVATGDVEHAARERAARAGVELELNRALIAFERTVERPLSTS